MSAHGEKAGKPWALWGVGFRTRTVNQAAKIQKAACEPAKHRHREDAIRRMRNRIAYRNGDTQG